MATTPLDPEVAVKRYYERVDAQDVAGILELFAPDVVYRRPGYEPIRGRDELETFYREQRVIESGRHTVIRVVRDENDIAVQGTFEGTLRDGSTTQLEFADFYRTTERGFAERTTYFYTPLV
jgi:ketosteroid isomerase-like protein